MSRMDLRTQWGKERVERMEKVALTYTHQYVWNRQLVRWRCWCSVVQSCLTVCEPMDCSTPGYSVLHHLPELAQTHVHWIGDAIQPSRPLPSASPPALNLFQHQGLLLGVVFPSGGQNNGASASAPILPVNIHGWFPLGLTSLIFLQSKGLSRVFSNTTVQKHHFFSFSLLYGPTLKSIHDFWKNHSFD